MPAHVAGVVSKVRSGQAKPSQAKPSQAKSTRHKRTVAHLCNALQHSDGNKAGDAGPGNHSGQQSQVLSSQVKSGKVGSASYKRTDLQDIDGDEVGEAGSGSHRGQYGQVRLY